MSPKWTVTSFKLDSIGFGDHLPPRDYKNFCVRQLFSDVTDNDNIHTYKYTYIPHTYTYNHTYTYKHMHNINHIHTHTYKPRAYMHTEREREDRRVIACFSLIDLHVR